MNFEEYFNHFIKYGEKRLTIIIGSGFHIPILGCNHLLSSWPELIRLCDEKYHPKSKSNFLLDFEQIIVKNSNIVQAGDTEKQFQKTIAKQLSAVQKEVLQNKSNDYVQNLFNPNYVSDIISLNFDTIAEELFRRKYSLKSQSSVFNLNLKGKSKIFNDSVRFNEYKYESNTIRFWYPHGNIKKPTSIILSARKYAMHISAVEQLRANFKKHERVNDYKIPENKQSWYSQIIQNPVLILGAGISHAEWDLWSAFVNRKRNFAAKTPFSNPVFQMRTDCFDSCSASAREWFDPIFDESMSFENQWKKLVLIFEQ